MARKQKSLIEMLTGGSVLGRVALAEVVRAVASGADLNECNEWGVTALDCAIAEQLDDIAWWMLDQGARLESFPLYFAAKTGNLKLVTHLLDKGLDCHQNFKGFTPLLVCFSDAAQFQRANLVVRQGGRVVNSAKTKKLAAQVLGEDRYANFLPIAQALVSAGADINYVSPQSNQGVLHYCGDRGGDELAEFAIKQGAHLNGHDVSGLTPLHYAARRGRLEIVVMLLENGADPNRAEDYGFTPLHEAAENNHAKVLKALLAAGADPRRGLTKAYEGYDQGFTAADVARARGHSSVVKLLKIR